MADAMHLDLVLDGARAEPSPETPSALIVRHYGDGVRRIAVVAAARQDWSSVPGLATVLTVAGALKSRDCAQTYLWKPLSTKSLRAAWIRVNMR